MISLMVRVLITVCLLSERFVDAPYVVPYSKLRRFAGLIEMSGISS